MQVLKTAGSWHIIFFIISIFLGSIYLMNLILAIVAMSYNELQRCAEEEEEAAAEDEAAFLESCRQMELLDESSNHSNSDMTGQSSYRPSVEIGLVGQSLLASLCQNGLLGQHVRNKLNQQMIFPNLTGNHNMRSHSLSAGGVELSASGQQVSSHLRPSCAVLKRASVASSGCHYDPPITACSMTELRRRSSNLNSGSNSPTNQLIIPSYNQPSSHRRSPSTEPSQRLDLEPMKGPHHRYRLSPREHHVSSSVLMIARANQLEDRNDSLKGTPPRSSIASDKDIEELKQKAALIKIVSDDYSDRPIEVCCLTCIVLSLFQYHT